ncbi:MAG: diguanylate cyclase [Deltaproteobacteria bacterium]|nr:diguanylate cyclase [Deltaproteobacteria bacterium]
MKLTINQKLLLSYLAMALLTVVASAYAIVSLQHLNKLAYAIINKDFLLLDTSRQMLDTLLAQESAEKKYLILKDPSLANIFWERSRTFKNSIERMHKNQLPDMTSTLALLSGMHDQYDNLFRRETAFIGENRIEEAATVSEREGRKSIEDMAALVHQIENRAGKDMDSRMNLIRDRSTTATRITAILSVTSLIAGFSLALLITYNIARPLKKLERMARLIAEGNFNYDLNMNRQDSIGSLAQAFIFMAERLKILETINRDASPLTGLPGNIAIENCLKKWQRERKPFSLCHVDLDNFKPFADKYGYAWASEVIKEVGNIIVDRVKATGHTDAFIGHIGGDDFIVIAEPDKAETICKQIVSGFDQSIMKFYTEQDRKTGFILGNDRSGKPQQFPLITVTIAVVTDDGTRFKTPHEMAKVAAELKEHAKRLPGNKYVKQGEMEEEKQNA